MAKLETLSLEELYSRKITASVEKNILLKEDFSCKSDNWCSKVCKLNCKNPPVQQILVPAQPVDVLIIQDYKAFDEPRFKKKGENIERTHRLIISYIADKAFKKTEEFPKLSYAVTTLLKCKLEKEDIKRGKAPTDTILQKCRPYLLKEIELRKPKVIISLCTSATKALGMKKTNYGNRGEIDGNVIFTIHPRVLLMLRQNASGKFWGPDFFRIILRDFEKAAALCRGQLKTPNLDAAIEKYKKNIFIAQNIEEVKNYCAELYQAGMGGSVLSYDLETNSLDPWADDSKIITAQFGYRVPEGWVKAIVFPLFHKENKAYDPQAAWEFIRPILTCEDVKKIGHNIKFDILFTYGTMDCMLKGVLFDTMLLLHHIDSGTQGNLGLKQAVWDHLPETELGGYEEKLPKLTKIKPNEENEEDGEEGSEEVEE